MSELFPVQLYERGYTELISVVPPSGELSPGSKITADQRGKVPGRMMPNGLWAGYPWRTYRATLAEVRHWSEVGANIGLRSGQFPGLDIDSLDAELVEHISGLALNILGPAPARVGRAPKRLLMYRASAPFARMRMWLEREGTVHLVEMLAEGQQYLVHGIHPTTMLPYQWLSEIPDATKLTAVTPEAVSALFSEIILSCEERGFRARREGDGRRSERTAGDQAALRAPNMDMLAAAVALIPNELPTREEYIRFGYAVKAAAGDDDEGGFELFSEWAARWTGGHNAPDTVRSDWRRMQPPYSVGWGWLSDQARAHGFSDAQSEFGILTEAPVDKKAAEVNSAVLRPRLSDTWIARQVTKRIGDRLRYVPQTGQWLAWDGARWRRDDTLGVQAEISGAMCQIASEEMTAGLAARDAKKIESARTLFDVMRLVRADRAISVVADALDADPWLLNTPAGVVDLRTAGVSPARPEQLHTKSTSVGPDMRGAPPRWLKYLKETTGGNRELELYLQRLAGYCLTGSTSEQKVTFCWGPGGNGKSIFVNTLREVMGDYATVSAMDVFTSSSYDRHSTELASLCGARLVTASETQAGRQWDEQRIKAFSGGDSIKARFMRQDEFVFRPLFKLLFSGNHQPNVRHLDEALKRRVNMVPFVNKPPVVDLELQEKLKAEEYAAILGWMIEGALEWRKIGLAPPGAVLALTTDYFDMEDSVGQWIDDACIVGEDAQALTLDLYQSWREWCGEHGEKPGLAKTLVQALRVHGYEHIKDIRSRRGVFKGLAPHPAPNMKGI